VARQHSPASRARRLNGLLRSFFQRLAATRGFARIAPRIVPPLDRFTNRISGGRTLLGDRLMPHLLLTTTGAKSGLPRRTPLACFPESRDTFLVVGSNFGRDHHPGWSANLLKNPEASVTFRGRVMPVIARLLTGPARDEAWDRLMREWPLYAHYTDVSGRELRVFRLSPKTA
jgi:deazaflavin-dependent oxidoreductase (nitroreductase family)